MEETKSNHGNKSVPDNDQSSRWARSPARETYIDKNGVTQPRYLIRDLGQKKGQKLGFAIWDNRRFRPLYQGPFRKRRDAVWFLMKMEPDPVESTAPMSGDGTQKEAQSKVGIDAGDEEPVPINSSAELVPTTSSHYTRSDGDIQVPDIG